MKMTPRRRRGSRGSDGGEIFSSPAAALAVSASTVVAIAATVGMASIPSFSIVGVLAFSPTATRMPFSTIRIPPPPLHTFGVGGGSPSFGVDVDSRAAARRRRRISSAAMASDDDDEEERIFNKEKKDVEESRGNKNPLELASWFAVEAFGKALAPFTAKQKSSEDGASSDEGMMDAIDFSKPPSSLAESLRRIQLDNDRSYFLSGQVDAPLYDEDCTFADPFVSFDGRDRFIENLSNLGAFITKYNARVLKYDVENDGTTVVTKVMVKLELNLPWKPVLAWPWGVTYAIDPNTYLVTDHLESWDVAPWEGVKQIFRRSTVKIK